MTFTTLTFFLFVALVFALYWASPRRRLQNGVLVLASYIFYAWWDWRFMGLLLFSSLLDFGVGLAIAHASSRAQKTLYLWVSIVANLGLLGVFKYFNFFATSTADLFQQFGLEASWTTMHIVLPVGISFYTFQTLAYTMDVYRKNVAPCRSLLDYLAYVSFFPQLVAGPIERASNMLPQLESPRTFHYPDAVSGGQQILWGALKKLLIADNLALLVDRCYGTPSAFGGGVLTIATVAFAVQIYCDFSGYSDMAIGTARLFGIRLTRNFSYPYFAQNPVEFWRRWHISLSTWFRDYVFIPLGGSRVGRSRLVFNLLLTFLVSGLWHGAKWTFIVWGGINGLAVVLFALWGSSDSLKAEQTPAGEGVLPSLRVGAQIAATFLFVCLTWVIFRSDSLAEAWMVLGKIFSSPLDFESGASLLGSIPTRRILVLTLGFGLFEWVSRSKPQPLEDLTGIKPLRWAYYTAALWLTIILMPPSTGPFIYFQF